MRSLLCTILLTPITLCLAQQAHEPINLWPADAGKVAEEKVVAGKGGSVKRITDIHQATITPFRLAVPPDAVHPAVLIFPGGGYSILAIDKEGTEIAEWLNRIGYSAFVVKYRVPKDSSTTKHSRRPASPRSSTSSKPAATATACAPPPMKFPSGLPSRKSG